MDAATIASDVQEALQVLAGIDKGTKYTDLERIIAFRHMVASGKVFSYVRLLPLILNLNGEPYKLLDHYSFESVFGTYLPPELLMKCSRQVSKSLMLNGSAKVWLADGRRISGEDLVVGDVVQTMTDDFRIVASRVLSVARHAGKPVLRITSRLGTVLEIAETHPLRLLNGWVVGADLRIEDRICAVRRGGEFINRPQPRARIITTAYLIGDGHISHNCATLTAMCEEVLDEFSACVNTSRRRKSKGKASAIRTSDKHVMHWLADDGLLNKHSWDKTLPNWVFELSREDTILFLSRLWATDGMVKHDKTKPQITYCTVCRDLAFQVKSLLAKFGIQCSIKRREAGYTKNGGYKRCRDVFIVRVETRRGWQIFLDTFQVPGKPGFQLRDVAERNNRDTIPSGVNSWIAELTGECRGRRGTGKPALSQIDLHKTPEYPLTRGKFTKYIEFFHEHNPHHPRLRELENLINGDVIWDEITAIEPIGEQPCWDVEVEGTHNYILDGIVSHNSTSMAARGLAISTAIPHFSTLFITPLYEQIRRFSTNYVRPFIDQSPIKGAWIGTGTENSVLQRSFQNFSKMYFSFALASADRVRGVSAHSCNIDESECGITTYIKTSSGKKRLIDIKPGDVVESFRRDGTIVWDPVVKRSYHGYRRCFTVRISDGCELTATSESVIATSKGWKHVSDLITEAAAGKYAAGSDRESETTCTRYAVGRWEYDIRQEYSTLLQSPRLVPARIQFAQVHSLTRVRTHTSREEEEWRLRGMVERLHDHDFAGLRLYRRPLNSRMTDDEREDKQRCVAEVLPYMQTNSDASEQVEVCLEEVSIESIKYAGYRHVYDIETALNHTFVANNIAVSNCQDMDPNLIPIIKETMSASKWRLSMYTGTPKTLDNTIEGLWQSSSQAEWCIPCMNCKKFNVPHMGMDLERMIGPNRPDICNDNPAVICAKCLLPINPRNGRWVHKFKERRFEFPGYHVPQIIMPIHYSSSHRWGELLAKQQGYGNYTIPQFYNEVLGESYDVGAKLLTKTDLENASVLPWVNDPLYGVEALQHKNDYILRVLGVDWGGGGEVRRGGDKKKAENFTMSFTCAAVVGLRGDGRLDVIYGRRLLTPHDHMEEAKQLMRIYQMFDCQLMAHDYNGAGTLRETIAIQSGLPINRVVPIVYTRAAWQNIMNFHRSEDKHSRNFWLVDKARSLQLLCQCIKMAYIRLFKHDYVNEENRGLQHDFLSLMENKVETARGPDVYTIQRNPHFPDDFAHAVNFAACALWNETKTWPNIAELAHLKMTIQQMNQINPVRPWLDGGYLGQP